MTSSSFTQRRRNNYPLAERAPRTASWAPLCACRCCLFLQWTCCQMDENTVFLCLCFICVHVFSQVAVCWDLSATVRLVLWCLQSTSEREIGNRSFTLEATDMKLYPAFYAACQVGHTRLHFSLTMNFLYHSTDTVAHQPLVCACFVSSTSFCVLAISCSVLSE